MARTAKTSTGGTRKTSTVKSSPVPDTSIEDKTGASSEPEPAPEPAPEPNRSGGVRWIVFVLIIALGGGAAYLSYPQWYPEIADKIPGLPKFEAEDPRVPNLSERIAALETQAGANLAKDETIARLEKERERLSADLNKALARLETVEKSMASVREMAEAAARVEETAAAKDSLQALSDRLATLEVTKLSDGGAITNEQISALQAAQAETQKLDDRMAQLEKSQATATSARDTLVGVEQRLAAVEKRPLSSGADDASRAAILLAVGQLRDTARSGSAYVREYDAVKALAGDDPGIGAALLALGKSTKTGVPTLTVLRDEFAEMAGPVVAKARRQNAEGWLAKVMARV
ncbi:MAG: hypothetical protein HOH04_00435, partial [Rhodospirillaceae bacterium]|nr:hypothetical protein [Rhodospirillaceae bacterium]